MELKLTKHFEENWVARVGSLPTPAEVDRIIQESVRIQGSRLLRKADGSTFRVLAIYWHPDMDLVIKYDPSDRCAVTVMSRACWRYDGAPVAADKPPAEGESGAPMGGRVAPMRRREDQAIEARAERVARDFSGRRRA